MVYIRPLPDTSPSSKSKPRSNGDTSQNSTTTRPHANIYSKSNEKAEGGRLSLGVSPEPVSKATSFDGNETSGARNEQTFKIANPSNEEEVDLLDTLQVPKTTNSTASSKQSSHNCVATASSTISATYDQVFVNETENWISVLRQGIATSFDTAKQAFGAELKEEIQNLRATLKTKKDALREQERRHIEQVQGIQRQLKDQKAFMEATSVYLSKRRMKAQMILLYSIWKAKYHECSSIKQKEKQANEHYKKEMMRRILLGWHSITRTSWKHLTEKKIRDEIEKNMFLMSNDYENKIAKLNEKIQDLNLKLQETRIAQEQHEQQMKQAFLRGISALNLEAMGIFNHAQEATPVSNNAPPALQSLNQEHFINRPIQSVENRNGYSPRQGTIQSTLDDSLELRKEYARLNTQTSISKRANMSSSSSTKNQNLHSTPIHSIQDQLSQGLSTLKSSVSFVDHQTFTKATMSQGRIARKNGLVTRHYT